MSLLDEFRKPRRIPDEGFAPGDIIAALNALVAKDEIRDKRVLGISVHNNGTILIRTGVTIGGYEVVLRKSGGNWEVAEWEQWIC